MDATIFGHQGVSLRHLSPDMAEAIAREANDPDIALCLRDIFPYPYTREHAVTFIELVLSGKGLKNWAIYSNESFAGMIGLTFQEDIYRHSAEIGFWLGKKFHGKGIMTEAVRLASLYAFGELNLYRLFAGVFEPNIASKRVLLKNGFQIEGLRRKSVLKNKQFLNDFLMAKLKHDE